MNQVTFTSNKNINNTNEKEFIQSKVASIDKRLGSINGYINELSEYMTSFDHESQELRRMMENILAKV